MKEQSKPVVLKSFDGLSEALNSKITPEPGVYKINVTTSRDGTCIRFTLPSSFKLKRFELEGNASSAALVENKDGVLFNAPEQQKQSCYASFSGGTRGLDLLPAMPRKTYEAYWDGKKIVLGNVLARFVGPKTIGVAKGKQERRAPVPIKHDDAELADLKGALATVNRIAKQRGMEVIIHDDGTIGLKMVVETVF